jgi:hypothetical protein
MFILSFTRQIVNILSSLLLTVYINELILWVEIKTKGACSLTKIQKLEALMDEYRDWWQIGLQIIFGHEVGSKNWQPEQMLGDYDLAREILKEDFITPEEITAVCKRAYTKKQLRHFAETVPGEKTLQRLQFSGFILVAGPPKAKSLVDIYNLEKKVLLFRE